MLVKYLIVQKSEYVCTIFPTTNVCFMQDNYYDLFSWIHESAKTHGWGFHLTTLLTDFELAPHAAKQLLWQEKVKSKGCRFHFGHGVMVEIGNLPFLICNFFTMLCWVVSLTSIGFFTCVELLVYFQVRAGSM